MIFYVSQFYVVKYQKANIFKFFINSLNSSQGAFMCFKKINKTKK